jgi:hypothetical protein
VYALLTKENQMKRRKIEKAEGAGVQSLTDLLRNCSISICVILDELRMLDPNDYYDKWLAHVDSLLTVAEVLKEAHEQSGKYVHNVQITLPPDVVMVTYRQMSLPEATEEPIDNSTGSTREGSGDVPF